MKSSGMLRCFAIWCAGYSPALDIPMMWFGEYSLFALSAIDSHIRLTSSKERNFAPINSSAFLCASKNNLSAKFGSL